MFIFIYSSFPFGWLELIQVIFIPLFFFFSFDRYVSATFSVYKLFNCAQTPNTTWYIPHHQFQCITGSHSRNIHSFNEFNDEDFFLLAFAISQTERRWNTYTKKWWIIQIKYYNTETSRQHQNQPIVKRKKLSKKTWNE